MNSLYESGRDLFRSNVGNMGKRLKPETRIYSLAYNELLRKKSL